MCRSPSAFALADVETAEGDMFHAFGSGRNVDDGFRTGPHVGRTDKFRPLAGKVEIGIADIDVVGPRVGTGKEVEHQVLDALKAIGFEGETLVFAAAERTFAGYGGMLRRGPGHDTEIHFALIGEEIAVGIDRRRIVDAEKCRKVCGTVHLDDELGGGMGAYAM